MRRILVGILAVIGGLSLVTVLGLVVAVVVALRMAPRQPALPGSIVLDLDLTHDLAEGPSEDPLHRIVFGPKSNLRDVLDGLERAAGDKRVKGVYAELGDDANGLAKIEEVRDALAAFRAQGKFAIAFADTFGELGPGTRPYYLATAFDEIWLQPQGDIGLTGLASETPFVRGLLDKLGIAPRFARRREYKTVMNSLTDAAMPAPQREELDGLLDSLDNRLVGDIAAARHLSEPDLRRLIDRAPLLADEAKQARLVDRLGYRDEALARAAERAGPGSRAVSLLRYLDSAGRPHRSGAEVALIYGTGLITRAGGGNALISAEGLDVKKVAAAFRAAAGDKSVRAILFRIDSPGGSAVASESLWREVYRARARGKPVIVSMGDVAASGGYYIAAPADKIVAEPATLTGSIGVVAGKLVLAGLMQKLGVAIDPVERGANAGMFSAAEDFSPAERDRLDATLDATYAGFKAHVEAGRHLAADAVEAVAKGRVWSGAQAKENGLVDALGGYRVALKLAREAAHLPAGAPLKLTVFPRAKSTIEEFVDRYLGRGEDGAVATWAGRAAALAALVARIDAAFSPPGTVEMPSLGEVR